MRLRTPLGVDPGPGAVVEDEGDGLNGGFDQADGQGGAPVLGDEVGDSDCNRKVHQGVGAGLQGEAHFTEISLLRLVRKWARWRMCGGSPHP